MRPLAFGWFSPKPRTPCAASSQAGVFEQAQGSVGRTQEVQKRMLVHHPWPKRLVQARSRELSHRRLPFRWSWEKGPLVILKKLNPRKSEDLMAVKLKRAHLSFARGKEFHKPSFPGRARMLGITSLETCHAERKNPPLEGQHCWSRGQR